MGILGKLRNIKVSLLQYIFRKRSNLIPENIDDFNDRDLSPLINIFPDIITNMDVKRENEGILLKAIHQITINSISLGYINLPINKIIKALQILKETADDFNKENSSNEINNAIRKFMEDVENLKNTCIYNDQFIEVENIQHFCKMSNSLKNAMKYLRLMGCTYIPMFAFNKISGIEILDLETTNLVKIGKEIKMIGLKKIYFPKTLKIVHSGCLNKSKHLELVRFRSHPIIEDIIPLNVRIEYYIQ